MNKYENIVDFDYRMKHDRMSIYNRSAQFAPFSALTGYSELIQETGRETTPKIDILEDDRDILDIKLKMINKELFNKPIVSITYFVKDSKKSGGKYETCEDYIKKIDFIKHFIVLSNNLKIKIDDILLINSNDIKFDDLSL